MTTKEKMILMYNKVHGPISASCYWEFDEESNELICTKDGNECWRVSREEIMFDYISKDLLPALSAPSLPQPVLIDGEKLLSLIEEERDNLINKAKFYKDSAYLMNANDCIKIIVEEIKKAGGEVSKDA